MELKLRWLTRMFSNKKKLLQTESVLMCKGPADPLSTCSTVSHTEAESSLEFASIWFLPTIESLYCVEKKFRTLNTPLTNINFRKPICRAASSV